MKLFQNLASWLLLAMLVTGCNGAGLPQSVFPTPPGWRSPVAELLLDESDFPDGWQIDFNSPQDLFMDPTVNHVGRELWNPEKGSAGILQSIWRSYTVSDAKKGYTELRQSPLLLARLTPIPEDFYVEFNPPPELSFQSQVADEFYMACGWVVWAHCKVVARYRNYTVELNLALEAEHQGHISQGLTYIEIEVALKAMDNKFQEFFSSQLTPTP
jgi:hypothetical protein